VGIAVHRLEEAYRLYRDVLGLPLITEASVPDQGVRAALLAAGDSEIELLEPLGADSGMRRFLARHGEGLHHVCFETPDVGSELAALKNKGAELIDAAPRPGLAGRIGFLHPRSCAGVLVELAMTDGPAHEPGSALRLKRLVIGAKDPRGMATVFQGLFGFSEIPMNGGPRVMLGVGRGALLIVPHGEVGGTEGMVALSMVSDDFDGLLASLENAGTRGVLRGTGEVTLEPVATHGVHFHISRYE
jgi:methylmalonyl-CoA/ethylmalonyl-CoA epimerase